MMQPTPPATPTPAGSLARRYWKAPFRYDEEGTMIWDANNERVLDVRGWGYLTGKGSAALGLPPEEAATIQNDLGKIVVQSLNLGWDQQIDSHNANEALAGQLVGCGSLVRALHALSTAKECIMRVIETREEEPDVAARVLKIALENLDTAKGRLTLSEQLTKTP